MSAPTLTRFSGEGGRARTPPGKTESENLWDPILRTAKDGIRVAVRTES